MNAGSIWQPMASVGTVSTRALVTLLQIGQPFDGITIYCDEVGIKEYYKLDLLSGAVVDGNSVLNTSLGGTSRWLKLSTSGLPGTGGLFRNVVYVAKNGNNTGADGSVNKPFLTVQAALQYAWTTYVLPAEPQPAPPFTRATVFVCPGTYDDGALVLPPQICVMGMGGNFSRITGNWTIDDRWSNYVPPSLPSPPSVLIPSDMRSMFLLVGIFGSVTIDWNAHFSNEGKLWTQDCRFAAGTFTVTEKVANPSSNQWYSQNCEHLGDVVCNGVNVQFTAPQFTTDPNGIGAGLTLNQSGSAPDFNGTNYFCSYGGTIGSVTINATTAGPVPAYEARFGHASQPGAPFTLNGTFSVAKCNANAVPQQSVVALLGGALLTQITNTNPDAIPTSPVPALNIDWSLSDTFTKTIAVNSTFTFSNVSNGGSVSLRLTAGAGNTATFPAGIRWPGGVQPVQTSSGTDIYTFISFSGVIFANVTQALA